MFGYIRYDLPNLFVKDYSLYQAMYCGLCKGIGETCGQAARMGLSYDLTFVSAILHNLTGEDVKIEKQHCIEHSLKKHPMALVDELTRKLGALNTVLLYYKLTDDVLDKDGGKLKRKFFSKGYLRARKAYPKLDEIVRRNMETQDEVEKAKTDSLDRASDATATMLGELSSYLLGNKATEDSYAVFYHVGKWIYLIDALDDYDKDKKKGAYNPFVLAYGESDKKSLVEKRGEEISFVFDTVFYAIREHLKNLHFSFNRDLTDNILLRGLPMETKRVLSGEPRKKEKAILK